MDYRWRDDGLVDLFALGITGPNAQACLASIAARADPLGPQDLRPTGQRRLDALVDLLCGRDLLTGLGRSCPGISCGCPSGAGVPCGAQVYVHVQLGAALGVSDQPAELVGHGPLDAEQLTELLLAAPQLRTVWVDGHGTPLAVADRTHTPTRHHPTDLRRALLTIAAEPPPPPEQWHPRHPDDHHPPDAPDVEPEAGPAAGPQPGPAAGPQPGPAAGLAVERTEAGPLVDSTDDAPPPPPPPPPPPAPAPASTGLDDNVRRALTGLAGSAHPAGAPGSYQVPRRLRRLLTVRSPHCEWPGCGARATRCDQDHDLAWPDGPTCACNLGPACRRHHRVKQTGWTKTRTATGLTWTGPSGRSRHSPSGHQPPAPPVRALPPVVVPGWLDDLTPLQREDAVLSQDPCHRYFDGSKDSGRCDDTEAADDHDRLRRRIRSSDTRWTLDLENLQDWQPAEADRDLAARS